MKESFLFFLGKATQRCTTLHIFTRMKSSQESGRSGGQGEAEEEEARRQADGKVS